MASINSELSDVETENISFLQGRRPRSRGHARRVFGLKNRGLRYAHARFNPYGYEQKYPEDPHGEEIGVNARVWWTYLDVAEECDSERMENWKDTIDVLLIFAGLFSAIVPSFAVQSWQDSQPDYGEMTVSLLLQLFALQAGCVRHLSTNLRQLYEAPQDTNLDKGHFLVTFPPILSVLTLERFPVITSLTV